MKYVFILLVIVTLLSCAVASKNEALIAEGRPTTGSEGVPGYVIRNPGNIKGKVQAGHLQINAPAGTIEATLGKAEEAKIAVWNTSAAELKEVLKSETGTKALSVGHELAVLNAQADGSFSLSVANPVLDKDSIALFLVKGGETSLLSVANGAGDLMSAFQPIPQGAQETSFSSLYKLLHTIFVTSTPSSGDLGGLAGADAVCQVRGEAGTKTSKLKGAWRAILSSDAIDARDRISFALGSSILNTNLETVLSDSSLLWSGGNLSAPIQYDENGALVSAITRVWTATNVDGRKVTLGDSDEKRNCDGWNSSNLNNDGFLGDLSATSTSWIYTGNATECRNIGTGNTAHLYCISAAQ